MNAAQEMEYQQLLEKEKKLAAYQKAYQQRPEAKAYQKAYYLRSVKPARDKSRIEKYKAYIRLHESPYEQKPVE